MIRPSQALRLIHINLVLLRHGLDEVILATSLASEGALRTASGAHPSSWGTASGGDDKCRRHVHVLDHGVTDAAGLYLAFVEEEPGAEVYTAATKRDQAIISHSEDLTLSEDGVMNEGHISAKLGLKGIPVEAEQIMIFRDILLSELTGGRLHIAHVSTEGSVSLIREAKKRGVQVTAETCPHYFSITEKTVEGYNTNAKVNPPLRTEKDIEAIKAGLHDGTIDIIATDHAPHHMDEKLQEFDKAPFGISGLETGLSLSLQLVHDSILTLPQLIEKMTINPAKILQVSKGSLLPGSDADLTLIDLHRRYTVHRNDFVSLGKNTPFEGWTLKGSPVLTVSRGSIFE